LSQHPLAGLSFVNLVVNGQSLLGVVLSTSSLTASIRLLGLLVASILLLVFLMPASFRWSCCRQHHFAGLVASVLSSLAGLSLCQHPFAGLLAGALSRLSLVLLTALSRLSLILLVGFHRLIGKGSAIEKPYNRDYLTSIDYKQAIT
jgi:hypothetical protein